MSLAFETNSRGVTPGMLAIIPFYKKQQQLDRCMTCLSASQHPVEAFVVDNNRDMFLTLVHKPEIHKICNMVDSFCWND